MKYSKGSFLNASNPNVNFKYSVDDIIWKVRTAYATGMYQLYADCLNIENNRGGDIACYPFDGNSCILYIFELPLLCPFRQYSNNN
ncbi:MAG: hypothetical protein LBC20_03970 [Planctomycetaceae bacterium]|nr:hypothetical protein [Planctomycetaceae bacterium]